MSRSFLYAGIAIAMALSLPLQVRAFTAITAHSNVRNVPYVIGFHPLNSSAHPYLGQMHLNFNQGVISGTYTDISNKPGGPFANAHNLPVSGGLSGSHVTLHVRQVTFRGTMSGEKMSGSATISGIIYTFAAQQGTPGSGK
jgi:hypothetical protein